MPESLIQESLFDDMAPGTPHPYFGGVQTITGIGPITHAPALRRPTTMLRHRLVCSTGWNGAWLLPETSPLLHPIPRTEFDPTAHYIPSTKWNVAYHAGETTGVTLHVHHTDMEQRNAWGAPGRTRRHRDHDGRQFATPTDARAYAYRAGLIHARQDPAALRDAVTAAALALATTPMPVPPGVAAG